MSTMYSTTSTATYMLLKYSRSYPQTPQENNSEWQHYTKPLIKLILDMKRSSVNELDSVLLRIIWSMESSHPQDRNELTFENFDMLSFSSLVDKQQGGLPLKAVYRDSVVGIRYLDSSNGTFRRFQITFSSTSEASQFVDSISSVCPCKANNAAGPPAPQIMAPAPSIVPQSLLHPTNTAGSVHLAHDLPFPHHVHPKGPSPPHSDMFPVPHRYPTMHFQHPGASSYASMSSGMPRPMSSSPVLVHHAQISSSPLPPPSGQPPFHFNASQTNSHSHSQLSSPHTHTPTSTQPRSEQPCYSPSSSSVTMGSSVPFTQTSVVSENIRDGSSTSRPRAVKKTAEKDIQTADPFVFALQEATSLYHLSHGSLEKLVGDVAREDGFVHLMESLSSMWKVKGYINS